MKSLSNEFQTLKETLPILKDYAFGKCCRRAREKYLANNLIKLFSKLNVKINEGKLRKEPINFYNSLRKIILKDSSLSSAQKIDLTKLM